VHPSSTWRRFPKPQRIDDIALEERTLADVAAHHLLALVPGLLVIAPGLPIASQLHADFDPSNPGMFYIKCRVIEGQPFPEPVEMRGTTTNQVDLEESDVVITNIHQLQGAENRWLLALPDDFFDLILFDEGHHNVAASWDTLRSKFPAAKIVNFSATPSRADGQLMAGRIIYSYPIFSGDPGRICKTPQGNCAESAHPSLCTSRGWAGN
jgi:hypothetical protein